MTLVNFTNFNDPNRFLQRLCQKLENELKGVEGIQSIQIVNNNQASFINIIVTNLLYVDNVIEYLNGAFKVLKKNAKYKQLKGEKVLFSPVKTFEIKFRKRDLNPKEYNIFAEQIACVNIATIMQNTWEKLLMDYCSDLNKLSSSQRQNLFNLKFLLQIVENEIINIK